jgi:hypothetical protein
MVLAIKASILDETRGFEKVTGLCNLVPADVLMGRSSFNSGSSIRGRPAAIPARRDQNRRRYSGKRRGGEVVYSSP